MMKMALLNHSFGRWVLSVVRLMVAVIETVFGSCDCRDEHGDG
jgi:hypothetical protein